MKFALFLVLSLSAMAFAGPAFNKNNQIQDAASKQQQQQQQYMTTGADAKGPAIAILKQWCFSSQMSQQELTASFKKLVAAIKSNPIDETTESAVMAERICQGALVAKSQQTGETLGQSSADAQAHELIKDVYMDAMISCKSHECQQQLLKIVKSGQVDSIRASYYMTRIAVTDKSEIKSEQEIKQLAESFLEQSSRQTDQSEAVERQQLFATTSLIGKWISEQKSASTGDIQQVAEQVAKKIVERYVKRVSQQEVEQYKQTPAGQQVSQELAKKIAKRSAALKALANIPGHVLEKCPEVEQVLVELAQTKSELSTVRQSAIECLEQNNKQMELLKQLTFAQEEPIEVRIAAYRALMTSIYVPEQQQQQQQQTSEQKQQEIAREIVAEIVKHCEQRQQEDEQFVLYVVSHLDNVRTSQQAELAAIKETIKQDRQHHMQIQLLAKKLKSQLSDVRRSSRNYKLEQEFAQLDSGLVLEGDIVYSSEKKMGNSQEILPKLVRVNMSMPIMGETVNVVEITLRQDNMDEELLSALKLVQNTKFNQQTVSKVVDSFKQTAEKYNSNKQQQGEQAEADLTIKVDGQTVVFVSLDDFKCSTQGANKYQQQQHQRNTRSVYSSGSIVDEIVAYLKREPVSFNRGFNFNIQERIAKVLDIDANVIAGLRFESRAQGVSKDDFELVAQMEPRFSFEAIAGPAKLSSKKLMQRFSTKTALGLRLRFKSQELVDVELELPMNTMELFTFETQLVEKNARLEGSQHNSYESYNYLPESIYGQEDIYASYPIYSSPEFTSKLAKRSIVPAKFTIGGGASNNKKSIVSYLTGGKRAGSFSHSFETSKRVARATGLQGKLRMIGSPKDMSLLVSCIVEKHDQQMRGVRVKLEQSPARQTGAVRSYTLTMSTPGSSVERTMQVRITKQCSSARTQIASEIVSPFVSASASAEFVHDGRQYSMKAECVSRTGSSRAQWRHVIEIGVIAQQQQGRIAGAQQQQQQQFAYKPYLQIDSSALKRPIAMQGQVAYVQSPKTVISYELKCSAGSGTFVSGKLSLDARDNKMSVPSMRKRSSQMSFRRSMQSPLELIAQKDLTISHEFAGQLEKHAVKARQVLDWDCQKYSLEGNSLVSYKNRITQKIQELVASMKLTEQQQVFTVERKCPTDARKQWSVRVVSLVRPSGHEMQVESHCSSRRSSGPSALVAYKHKIDIVKTASNKYECAVELELVDTEHSVQENAAGRVRLVNERKHKQCQLEVSASRGKSAKLAVDFESVGKHAISFAIASERFAHKTELHNNERQLALVSRTDKPKTGEQLVKLMIELEKLTGPLDAKLVLEIPARGVSVAADLELGSGKRSSIAVQTGRFASQAEFSFELKPFNSYAADSTYLARLYPFARSANLRFRSNLKDLKAKQAYWMESQLNGADSHERSFMRLESPFYRSEFEFSPRSQEAKLAAYARSQPGSRQLDSIYRFSSDETNQADMTSGSSSLYEQLNSLVGNNKLSLGPSKMWMVRTLVASPFARDQLKKQARRALFEYADRRAQHKHSFVYSPEEQRVQMELAREPNTEFASQQQQQPMRFNADLSTEWSRPSTASLDTEWMSADVEAKPFAHRQPEEEQTDEQARESYAKISALSRVPRSTGFKKHESELRYNNKSGYKAHMKHVDSRDQRHELRAEAAAKPSSYAKADYESDKHGKANWEHKWRHEAATKKRAADQEEIFTNKMWLKREGPQNNKWQHETKLDWEEPTRMIAGAERRYRRSIFSSQQEQRGDARLSSYPIEYLKHTNARLVSSYSDDVATMPASENYKLDFDYQPVSNFASMNIEMPDEMSHVSHVAIKPTERSYKIASKLYNRRTNEPSYELAVASKPCGFIRRADASVDKLATAEQEPVFVHTSHPMLERPISTNSILYSLFKQPMKLDYSDKHGRVANFDYDQLESIAEQQQQQQIAGLRQKRAALYYKDPSYEVEHSSSYDFYPESFMTKIKPAYYKQQQQQQQQQQMNMNMNMNIAPVAIKTSTKYGPIVVRADSTDDSLLLDLESPLVSAKLTGETIGTTDRKLYKIELDNNSQRVQLAKLVRDFAPEQVRESKLVKKFVRKFDANKFEHQAELLVDLVEQIYKIKASSKLNSERPIVLIEGEWNQQSGKVFAKINGEQVDGQCIVDLVRKTADLTVSVDAKRTLHHVTRLAKTSDKFYALESVTSYKSRPLVKLAGKVSAKVFDIEHLMSVSQQQQTFGGRSSHEPADHVSTFEAIIYEPKEYHVAGQFDCDKKVARVVIKNTEEQKVQETQVSFAPETETVYVQSTLNSKYEGQIYSTKAQLSLPGILQSDKCMQASYNANKYTVGKYISKHANENQTSCKSEIVYSDNKSSGVWAAQYYPGEYVTVSSPRGKTTLNLAY